MYTATYNLQAQPAFENAEGLIAPFVVSFRGNNGLEKVKGGLIALMALLALKFAKTVGAGRAKGGLKALMALLAHLNLKKVIKDERGKEQPNE